MKLIALLFVVLGAFVAVPAQSEPLRVELLAGTCEGERLPPGGWWHPHYPHQFDLTSHCKQFSVSKAYPRGRSLVGWRLGWVDLGYWNLEATWWMRDQDLAGFPDGSGCNPTTLQDCLGLGKLRQRARGLTFGGLFERELGWGIRPGLEGGLYVYEGKFWISADPHPNGPDYGSWSNHFSGWQATPYLGVTLNVGYVMFSARRYHLIRAAEHGCGGCSGMTKGPATQVSLGFSLPF